MGGFGLTELGGADPGSPYYDPTQTSPMGFTNTNSPLQQAMTNTQAALAQYTPQQLAVAKARGMIGQNGVPLVPPSAFNVNSQGQPYTPGLNAKTTAHPFESNDPLVATPFSQPVFHTAAGDADQARADAIVGNSDSSGSGDYGGGGTDDSTATTNGGAPTWDSKNNNSEQLLRYYMTKAGMNPTAQAGALSNLYAESRLNPYAKNPGSSAYGYAQWLNNRGLDNFASSIGGSRSDPAVQAQFMVHELQTKFPNLVGQMNGAASPEDAGRLWLNNFEGINESNSQKAGANWATMQSTHLGNASNFFNGKSPRAGAAYAVSGGEHSGNNNVDDTSVDTSNMPPLTNYRSLANAALVDPSSLQDPNTSQLLQRLLNNPQTANMLNGGGNTSRTLANMAAGFFGGNGPAASLAGGFRGLAQGENEDQQTRASLLSGLLNNQNSLYRLGIANNMDIRKAQLANQGAMDVAKMKLQAEMPEHMATVASSLTRNGQMGPGSAANAAADYLHQPHPYSDADAQKLDEQSYDQKPLPPGIDNQLTHIGQTAQSASTNGQKLGQYGDWMHAGEAGGGFDMTPWAQAKYGVENSKFNLTGIQSAAAQKYNGYQSAIAGIAGDMVKAQQGPASDHRADLAIKALQGDNINSNISGEAHARMGQAASALQYRAAFNQYNNILASQKRSPVSQDQFDQQFGTSDPMAGKTNKEVLSYLTPAGTEADHSGGPGNAPPQVGGGGGGVGQITSPATGNTYQLVTPNQ